MSQEITILLDLKTAEALQKLGHFVDSASEGLKRLAERAVEAYLSFEGLKKLEEGVAEAVKLEEAVGRLAQKTGLAIPSVVAMREEAEKLGIPFDRLSFGLTQFSQKIYEAATSGGKAAETFQHLGVALLNSDGTLRSTDAILQAFLQRLRELPDGPQKAAAAMEMFGRAGKELIPILNDAAEAMERGVASPITADSVAQAMDFEQKLRQVNEAVEMLWVQVANKLLPSLTDLANRMLEFSRNADANREAVQALAGVVKGLLTVVLPLGLAFYDLGQMIGVALYVDIQDIIVAFNTMKASLADLKAFVLDLLRSLMDLGKTFGVVMQAFSLAETGQFAAAKDVIANHLKTLVADAKQAGHDMGKGLTEGMVGLAQVWNNSREGIGMLFTDWKSQWGGMAKFLKDMWSETAASSAGPKSSSSSAFTPVSTESVGLMNQMNALVAELYKQQQKLIEQDPLKTNIQKYQELLPLMQQQMDLVLQEYEAEKKIYDNPNTSEKDRMAALKEMVRLQGEFTDLQEKSAQIAAKNSFGTQFRMAVVDISNRWGTLAQQMAHNFESVFNSAVQSISRGITKLIDGTETWGQALREIGTAILDSIIQAIVQMGVQWALTSLLMAIAGEATTATVAATASAAWAAPAILASIATDGEAAIQGPLSVMGALGFAPAVAAMGAAAREFGGPVEAGRPYIVGEKRPELFIPSQSGIILPSVPSPVHGMAGGSGGGGSQPVQVHLAFHGGEAAAKRWAQSRDGQTLIVDTNKRTAKRFTR